jgi:hypothetical protein
MGKLPASRLKITSTALLGTTFLSSFAFSLAGSDALASQCSGVGPSSYSLSANAGQPVIGNAVGGAGCNGRGANAFQGGQDAGNGGDSPGLTVPTLAQPINAALFGIQLYSAGGNGGAGSRAGGLSGFHSYGGNGGNGAFGGAVILTTTSGATITGASGVSAIAAGGSGGSGNTGYHVGAGGGGGAGGSLALTVGGAISASAGTGIVATSIGGSGGWGESVDAGNPFGFRASTGGPGGGGGSVAVSLQSGITSTGNAVQAASNGGSGGNGGDGADIVAFGGNAAGGGDGGQVSVSVAPGVAISVPGNGGGGILAQAYGGTGGNGGSGKGAGGTGGSGGGGGDGGNVQGAVAGSITATGATGFGAVFQSVGGSGGAGAYAGGVYAGAGGGGAGGSGGSASGTLTSSGSIIATQDFGTGLGAAANGGDGGVGGNAGAAVSQAGSGGAGGNGGSASAINNGQIQTTGNFALGVLSQSVGGVGGNGANAIGVFYDNGGAGSIGGTGGTVLAQTGSGSLVDTTGIGASALFAQSVGGGGGYGGNATGVPLNVGIQLGGKGNQGGSGGAVTVANSGTLTTTGLRSDGITAQSVGGGGGQGGDAFGIGFVPINVAIGGDSGQGGDGAQVIVTNNGLITTAAPHASGITAQSIGGGGGKAGTAASYTAAAGLGFSAAIGGNGGSGGNGGAVGSGQNGAGPSNASQITTFGTDSFGIRFQSIGGGGGEAGAATALNVAISPDPEEIPAISLTLAIGGTGGNGGVGGVISMANQGLVMTGGNGSIGLFGQSIGGGGGNGGDSSATSFALAGESNISVSLALGGNGGTGGAGGNVSIGNSGLLLTAGESAYAAFGQSVGGGGGQAGGGDAGATSGKGDGSISLALAVGGNGGAGETGGAVSLTNSGGIVTLGDGAKGMFGQSVGGGGGAAGGGAAEANGGAIALGVGVGGSGGTGATGGTVTLNNTAAIATFGADASALVGQSIGGGGGAGGKAGKSEGKSSNGSGGNGELPIAIANGLGLGQTVVNEGGIVNQVGDGKLNGVTSMSDLIKILTTTLGLSAPDESGDTAEALNNLADSDGGDAKGGSAPSIVLNIGIGGRGGAGGDGGSVNITNGGELATVGHMSDVVLAQSVGGGGGTGGAATSSTSKKVNASIAIGGSGGVSGDGGGVTVSSSGNVSTIGGMSAGLVAHSVGGGGGVGGTSAVKAGGLAGLGLGLGGSGGAGGQGGPVAITNSGTITTMSHDSIGIIGQSIGGGGGIAKIRASDNDAVSGGAQPNGVGFALNLNFGGADGSSGSSGSVSVTNQGSIITSGRNSYGILAQSVGGGGGLALGGQLSGQSFFAVDETGSGTMSGNGNTVTVNQSGSIATAGDGAIGILAQSVGGGGGIAGDTALGGNAAAFAQSSRHSGSGGTVAVNVAAGSTVRTAGANASALFAQSIGGGGGLVTGSAGRAAGSTSNARTGGAINIAVAGTVAASGSGSSGIFAASNGGNVAINVQSGGVVSGTGNAAYAVNVADGGSVSLSNAGIINGNVDISSGTFSIATGGFLRTASLVSAAQTNNLGTIWLGTSDGAFQATVMNGDLQSSGTIGADVDFAGQSSDNLTVSGNAAVSGSFVVNPTTLLANKTVEVMRAASLDTTGLVVVDEGNLLFNYVGQQVGNAYTITSSGADFTPTGVALSRNQLAAAAHLQSAWETGEASALSESFAHLARIKDSASYGRTLNTLSGSVGGTVGAAKHMAGHNYFSHMNSCPTFTEASMVLNEQACVWGRVTGGRASLDTSLSTDGYTQSAHAFQIGAQHEVAPGWFLGASAAYERSRFESDNGADTVEGDSVWAAVVLKRQFGNWLISGAIDAGYGWYDSRRHLSFGAGADTAYGSPDTQYAGIHSRIAYQIPFASFYLKPYLDLHATYSRTEGYTESGSSPLVLKVSDADDIKFAAVPMIELGGKFVFSNGAILRPFVSAGASFHDDNSWGARAQFVGAPSSAGAFEAVTELPKAVGRVNVGAELYASEHAQFKLEYGSEFARGYLSHMGSVKFNYLF